MMRRHGEVRLVAIGCLSLADNSCKFGSADQEETVLVQFIMPPIIVILSSGAVKRARLAENTYREGGLARVVKTQR